MTDAELQSLSPQQASEMLERDPRALLVDVRSSMEFLFVGHPVGAVHLAWIDEPDWDVNPHFVAEVRKLVLGGAASGSGPDAPVILICRSGKRSKEAGNKLINAGFQAVYHIGEGFEGELDEQHRRSTSGGWRFRGMPWEQC